MSYTEEELIRQLNNLLALPNETEWVEFKEAKLNYDFNKIGKYFSALSNEANLKGKDYGWLIFGVNKVHHIDRRFPLGQAVNIEKTEQI